MKNTLQEIPVASLQQITREFPFFSVGQFLLTLKLRETGEPSVEEQFQKALIYFHNPLWFQYNLSIPTNTLEVPAPITLRPAESNNMPEAETFAVTAQISHDLMEEVILHPENDYNATPRSDTPEIPLEAHSVELINGHKEQQTQTIQRDEPFTFQAYYTVDYFASQGIKLLQDSPQQDKLGKQLKSFTEWLKTMRRLPETSVVEILDKINESEITMIAAHSLEEKHVITEAMAEVLTKQGQLEKARLLYNKLSLQNPHKSSYFAARIEALNQH